jgi:bifunctional oligoribonuclease and PAP phosphatase NrnA
MSRRINRVEEACKEELSDILQREVKDPRIGFVTITEVKVSPDLRHARVYVSIMGDEDDVKSSLAGLESARGYLRSHLGRHLRLKFLPEIEFVHEHVTEEALRLSEIMEKTKEEAAVSEREELARAASLIDDHHTALVFGHEHPDGDAIGSTLAFCHMLARRGYTVRASWPPPFKMPHKFLFLPGMKSIVQADEVEVDGLVITLDCANLDRLDAFRQVTEAADAVINIDHHPDNSRFGTVNIVDPAAAATAEIIYLKAPDLGLEVDIDAAVCLYTGIVTDTGKFQFANTSANTLGAASEMVALGVDVSEIYRNIYQNDSLAYLRLSGKLLTGAVFQEDIRLIYAAVTRPDLELYGVEMEETEDLIDSLRGVRDHRIAVVFKEMTDGRIRVSLRSRNEIDIGSVARKLGGGGHRVAAGYTSGARSIEDAVAELRREIIAGQRSPAGR